MVCIRGKSLLLGSCHRDESHGTLAFWCYLLLKHTLAREEITLEQKGGKGEKKPVFFVGFFLPSTAKSFGTIIKRTFYEQVISVVRKH